MSRVLRELLLRREGSDELLQVRLLAELTELEILAIDQRWHPQRAELMQRLLEAGIPKSQWPQSWHWDWSQKILAMQRLVHVCYALECDAMCHGIALLRMDPRYRARLAPDAGKDLVYVDFAEAAPSNWAVPVLGQTPRIKGIGTALIFAAIERSMAEEFEGRVGLHALPQSEGFYEGLGMTRLVPDPLKQGLVYYELTRSRAETLWKEGKWT